MFHDDVNGNNPTTSCRYSPTPGYLSRWVCAGVLNVVRACLHHNVGRLLYCSTVDVVVGFKPIRGGREEDTPVPQRFLFPGYPETKLQGERLVLAANGQLCHNGQRERERERDTHTH